MDTVYLYYVIVQEFIDAIFDEIYEVNQSTQIKRFIDKPFSNLHLCLDVPIDG